MASNNSTSSSAVPREDLDLHQHTHSVHFYSDDEYLIDLLSRFMGSAVGAGDAAVIIATPDHRTVVAERLSARGFNLAHAVDQGRYIALDAEETLSQFMVNGWPDEERFVASIGGVLSRARMAAQNEDRRLALFGEMVALLWDAGEIDAALRLEQLWNQIAQSHSFSLLCAYPLTYFYREEHAEAFRKVCEQHSVVVPDENYSHRTEQQRLRSVAHWQQKALALEHEVERRRMAELDARKLAAIVESSDDAIASKDLNGIVKSWNSAAERIFGYRAEEIVGRSIKTVIPPELHQEEDYILGRIRTGQRIDHYETVRVKKSGERIDISLTISPILDDNGNVIGAAKIARDITTRKRAEEAVRRAEKLAVTARMTLRLAHEINNPLEALTNALFLLRSHVNSADGEQFLSIAESQLQRVTDITKQTLAFYRNSAKTESVNLAELMDDLLATFASKIAHKRIMLQRREHPAAIRGVKHELWRLFSNLLENAIDAVEERGKIEIEVAGDDSNVVVTISDNGRGMSSEHLKKLFEPFFTTKEFDGTGLGLWTAREIAERHNGSIKAESYTEGPKRGTTFQVTLRGARESDVDTATAA